MAPMALVILGMFVLVWIISTVVKATQANQPNQRPAGQANRPRPMADNPRTERTSNTDIDRFMAEIDRLRNRGEGAPAGRPAEAARPQQASRPLPSSEPKPKPIQRREKERRPRAILRTPTPVSPPVAAPPPLPNEMVPVLKPLGSETASTATTVPAKPGRPSMTAAVGPAAVVSPVSQIIQNVLKSKHGPAAALILAEIFGEPPCKRAMRRAADSPPPG